MNSYPPDKLLESPVPPSKLALIIAQRDDINYVDGIVGELVIDEDLVPHLVIIAPYDIVGVYHYDGDNWVVCEVYPLEKE